MLQYKEKLFLVMSTSFDDDLTNQIDRLQASKFANERL